MRYAQVLRSDMRVNLIGGKEEGLPINLDSVICVNVSGRTDVKLYMKYNEKTDEFCEEDYIPVVIDPSELRRQAYAEMQIIQWEGSSITVDQANKVWLDYSAEANEKAVLIQTLIKEAKEHIRELYPDTLNR